MTIRLRAVRIVGVCMLRQLLSCKFVNGYSFPVHCLWFDPRLVIEYFETSDIYPYHYYDLIQFDSRVRTIRNE
jgi:hypothetical protein